MISWFAVGVSLVGVILNIKKKKYALYYGQ